MANRHDYSQGYIDGRKAAKKIVNQDIAGLYGAMCYVLNKDYDWPEEEYTTLLNKIQELWIRIASDPNITMMRFLEEHLSVKIVQMLTEGEE